MRNSSLKHSLKKKLIAAFTLGFVAFSMMQPVTAKAETTAAHTDEKYAAKNPDNMLGIAADFGVFVKGRVTADGHSDTNIACGEMNLGPNNGITPINDNAVNYADRIISRALIDKGYIYIKSGNVTSHPNNHYWKVDGHDVGGNGIKQLYIAPNFINMEEEFAKLISLSDRLSQLSTQSVTYDTNNSTITCNGDYNVLNISASELSQKGDDLFINNVRGNKLLIINVNMSGAGNDFKMNRKICFDTATSPDYNARLNDQIKEFDQDADNIIWNFYNYSGNIETLKATAGVILAPKAFVYINSGVHIGNVISDSMKNTNEVHYVPFNHKELSVQVSVTSINGNCCEEQSQVSRSLPGTEFAIFTLDGNEVAETRKTTQKISDNANIATWTLTQAGEYYIQETKTVAGFIKTPVKARFDVELQNGTLQVVKQLGKEANGYCAAYDNELNAFKIRHYSNEVVAVAYDSASMKRLDYASFKLVDDNLNPIKDADNNDIIVVTDLDGVAVINIPEPGYYKLIQTDTKTGYSIPKNCVRFAVYHTPIGHEMVVELDTTTGEKVLEILQKYYGAPGQMNKITKSFNRDLQAYGYKEGKMTDEYEAATDTCIVFFNDVIK